MDGIEKLVEDKIRKMGRGKIFFLQDFYGSEWGDVSVRMALSELAAKGTIIRLARGVYCYPRVVGEYGMKTLTPSEESIAEAIAAKENVRIIPFGDQAAYRLGLTTMRMSHLKYLTDGSPRQINLAKGRKIIFCHTSEVKMFAFRSETMQMISSAIRDLGEEYVCTEPKKRIIRQHLKKVSDADYAQDINLPPAWVGKIIQELWETSG